MEPQDCFSIPYVIILDNDIIVLLLVIIPSLLTCYLSQGSVSVILTLFTPVVGYGKMKARMYLHILPFISMCYWLTLFHALDEYMYVYMYYY